MAYKPKAGDPVKIKEYRGKFHPDTIWVVLEAREDLSKIGLPIVDALDRQTYTEEQWIENERLQFVHIPKPRV